MSPGASLPSQGRATAISPSKERATHSMDAPASAGWLVSTPESTRAIVAPCHRSGARWKAARTASPSPHSTAEALVKKGADVGGGLLREFDVGRGELVCGGAGFGGVRVDDAERADDVLPRHQGDGEDAAGLLAKGLVNGAVMAFIHLLQAKGLPHEGGDGVDPLLGGEGNADGALQEPAPSRAAALRPSASAKRISGPSRSRIEAPSAPTTPRNSCRRAPMDPSTQAPD